MTTVAWAGVGHIHTPGFINGLKKRDNFRVKSVWDSEPARAAKRAAEMDAAVVSDPAAIFNDPDIQAVICCGETSGHGALVIPAAEAKKHIFAEKPLGLSSVDATKMADAVDKAGVIFSTGYFMRSFPMIRFIGQQIKAGAFGKITRARGSNCHSGALGGWFDTEWRWMADPKFAGYGGFGDLGNHPLDILLLWFGEVESATAQIDNGTARYPGCDEFGEAMLRFKNGVIGTVAAGWDDVANPLTFLVSGTEGHAAIIDGKLFFQSKHVKGSDGTAPMRSAELPDPWGGGFDLWLDKLEGKDAAITTAREAAYRCSVMEAIYKGSRDKTWATPKPV